MSDSSMKNREVIFEFRPVGAIMRVTAIDAATGTEVIIQCPAGAGEAAFKKNGLMRLEYKLRKDGVIT
jgi:hypothetical protein